MMNFEVKFVEELFSRQLMSLPTERRKNGYLHRNRKRAYA